MQKISFLFIIFLFSTSLLAGTMSVIDGQYDDADLQETVNGQLADIADDLNNEASIILTGNQDDLANGCSSSSSGLVSSGMLYSGLDSKNVSIGFGILTASSVAPWNATSLQDDADKGKDTSTGIAVSGFVLNPSVNGDLFMSTKGFRFEAKFGMHMLDKLASYDLKTESLVAGAGVRYKFMTFPEGTPMWGLRSLTVGSGVYYTSTRLQYNTKQSPIEFSETDAASNTVTSSSTTLDFDVKNSAFVVPIEVVASAKTLHVVNLIYGAGFDLVYGTTEITVDQDTDITVTQDSDVVDPQEGGEPGFRLSDSTTKANADIFRSKLLFGFGFQAGPAKLEIPIAYYPIESGFTVSTVIGAEF